MMMRSRWLPAAAIGALLVASACSSVPPGEEASEGLVALTGVRVIDGTGAPPLEQATILIANGRIEAVGPDVSIPAGASQVDLTGKTVMPGMINSHSHVSNGDASLPVYDQLIQQLRLYAQYGVTSVITLGDDGVESLRVRDENESPTLDRARIFPAGPALVPRTVDEARQMANSAADNGVEIIKTRMNGTPEDMTPEVYTALIEEAHERGLKVAAHLYFLHEAKGLANAGVDIVAHSVRDQDVDDELIAVLKARSIGLVPTLTREVSVFAYESIPDFVDDPFFLKGVTFTRDQLERIQDPEVHERVRQSEDAQRIKKALEQAIRNLKLLSDAGVTIAMGTDSGASLGRWQGYFEHVELQMMVEAGMTPMQVLVAATGDAARLQGFDDLGTIQPGKHADMLVLDADPLADITNTRSINSVWIAGRRVGVPTGMN